MLNDSREFFQSAPWLMVYPGIAIFIIVSVFNLLGDGTRDLLDPNYVEKKEQKNGKF